MIPFLLVDYSPEKNLTCSCTIEWLYQDAAKYLYDKDFQQYYSSYSHCLKFDAKQILQSKCNFENLQRLCAQNGKGFNSTFATILIAIGCGLCICIIMVSALYLLNKMILKKHTTNSHALLINETPNDNETIFE